MRRRRYSETSPGDDTRNAANTVHDIRELFAEMRKRRYNVTRFKIGLGAALLGTGFLFYETITDFISSRATEVTHKSMEDPFRNNDWETNCEKSRSRP